MKCISHLWLGNWEQVFLSMKAGVRGFVVLYTCNQEDLWENSHRSELVGVLSLC